MSTPPTQYENALLHQLARLTEALDRNTLAVANGAKPMLTDAEAAQRLGFKGEHPGPYMTRMVTMGLFHSIHGGHHRLWSASQIDEAFQKAHDGKTSLTPSAQTHTTDRKQKSSAA